MPHAEPRRRILVLHPEGPGQFPHLAPHLASRHDVVFLSRAAMPPLPGVRAFRYRPHRGRDQRTHRYAAWTEAAVLAGQAALRTCLRLKTEGFVPDLCVVHPGWGDALFLREAFPKTRILAYCEYFWRGAGADVGFADGAATDLDAQCALRMRNAALMVSLEAADRLYAPTRWQRDLHPAFLRDRIDVIHDGIDVAHVRPDLEAVFTVPSGPRLTAADEVVSYVARGLEPQRGFPQLMRALPDLLRRRPDAQVVICGADTPAYGRAPDTAPTWRAALLDEIGPLPPRVHFVGTLAFADYLALLRVSSLHLYLSVPFVLSWSMTEAMATGCLVLGSDTAPVHEFITDGANGFLVDMRDPAAIADRAADLLARGADLAEVRSAARETIVQRCALKTCLAAQDALIETMLEAG